MNLKMLVGSKFDWTLPAGATILSKVPKCVTVQVTNGVATFLAVAQGGAQIVVTLEPGVTMAFAITVMKVPQ